jgi:hypothetical protein
MYTDRKDQKESNTDLLEATLQLLLVCSVTITKHESIA